MVLSPNWIHSLTKLVYRGFTRGVEIVNTSKSMFRQIPFGFTDKETVKFAETFLKLGKKFYFWHEAKKMGDNLYRSVEIRITIVRDRHGPPLSEIKKDEICNEFAHDIVDIAFYFAVAGITKEDILDYIKLRLNLDRTNFID